MFKIFEKTFSKTYKKIFKKYFSIDEVYNFKNTKLSHCAGPTGIKLLDKTIGEQLEETAKKFPDNIALIASHQNTRLTFEELDYKVSEVAKSLIGLELPVGSKIGVY